MAAVRSSSLAAVKKHHVPPRGQEFLDFVLSVKPDQRREKYIETVQTKYLKDVFPKHGASAAQADAGSNRDMSSIYFSFICFEVKQEEKDKILKYENNEVDAIFDDYFVGVKPTQSNEIKVSTFLKDCDSKRASDPLWVKVFDDEGARRTLFFDAAKKMHEKYHMCPSIACAYVSKAILETSSVQSIIKWTVPSLLKQVEDLYERNCLAFANALLVLLINDSPLWIGNNQSVFSGQQAFPNEKLINIARSLLFSLDKMLEKIENFTFKMTSKALNFYLKFTRILSQCLYLSFDVSKLLEKDLDFFNRSRRHEPIDPLKWEDAYLLHYEDTGAQADYNSTHDGLFVAKLKSIIIKCLPTDSQPVDHKSSATKAHVHSQLSAVLLFVLCSIMKMGVLDTENGWDELEMDILNEMKFRFIWGFFGSNPNDRDNIRNYPIHPEKQSKDNFSKALLSSGVYGLFHLTSAMTTFIKDPLNDRGIFADDAEYIVQTRQCLLKSASYLGAYSFLRVIIFPILQTSNFICHDDKIDFDTVDMFSTDVYQLIWRYCTKTLKFFRHDVKAGNVNPRFEISDINKMFWTDDTAVQQGKPDVDTFYEYLRFLTMFMNIIPNQDIYVDSCRADFSPYIYDDQQRLSFFECVRTFHVQRGENNVTEDDQVVWELISATCRSLRRENSHGLCVHCEEVVGNGDSVKEKENDYHIILEIYNFLSEGDDVITIREIIKVINQVYKEIRKKEKEKKDKIMMGDLLVEAEEEKSKLRTLESMIDTLTELVSCHQCNEKLLKFSNDFGGDMDHLDAGEYYDDDLIDQLLYILKDDNPIASTRASIFRFLASFYNCKCNVWKEEDKRRYFEKVVEVLDGEHVRDEKNENRWYLRHLTALIEEDIEEESKLRWYSILDGYLDYLCSMFSYYTPGMVPLGYKKRIHGDFVYIQSVLNNILFKIVDDNSNHFQYKSGSQANLGQKWKIVAKCMKLLNIILKNYDIESVSEFSLDDLDKVENPEFNSEILLDFLNIQQLNELVDLSDKTGHMNPVKCKVLSIRPKSAGFVLLASMFALEGPLYSVVMKFIADCNFDRIKDSKNTSFEQMSDQSYTLLKNTVLDITDKFATNTRDNLRDYCFRKMSCDQAYWMEGALSQCLGFLHLCFQKESKFMEIAESVQKWWMQDQDTFSASKSKVRIGLCITSINSNEIERESDNEVAIAMHRPVDAKFDISNPMFEDTGVFVVEQPIALNSLPRFIVCNSDLWKIMDNIKFRQLRHRTVPSIPAMTLHILEHVVKCPSNNPCDVLASLSYDLGTGLKNVKDFSEPFLIMFDFGEDHTQKDERWAALGNSLAVHEFSCPEIVGYSKLQLNLLKFLIAGYDKSFQSLTYRLFKFDVNEPSRQSGELFARLVWFLPNIRNISISVKDVAYNLKSYELAYELLHKLIDSDLASESIVAYLGQHPEFFTYQVEYYKKSRDILNDYPDLYCLYHNFAWFLDICSLIIFKCLTVPKFKSFFDPEKIYEAFLRDTTISVQTPIMFLIDKYCTTSPLIGIRNPEFNDWYFEGAKEPLENENKKKFPSNAEEFVFIKNSKNTACGCACTADNRADSIIEKINRENPNKNDEEKYTVEVFERFNEDNLRHHATCDVSNSFYRLMSLFMKCRPGLNDSIYNSAFAFLATGSLMEDLAQPLADLLVKGSNHPDILNYSLPPYVADPLAKTLLVIVNQITNDIVQKGLNFVSVGQLRKLLEHLLQLLLGLNDQKENFYRDHFTYYFSELHVCVSKILQLPFKESWSVTSTSKVVTTSLLTLNATSSSGPAFTDMDKLSILHMNLDVLHRGNRFISHLETALQLMDCLHTDMQNIQSEVRLTAITVLNDILLTLGHSIPETFDQHRNNQLGRDVSRLLDDIKRMKPSSSHLGGSYGGNNNVSLFHKCVSLLADQETLSLAASVINEVPSWSSNQSLWASENDFNEFISVEYRDHHKLFSAAVTLFNRIAAVDGGFMHLVNIGLFSILISLPYFTMSPPTTNQLILRGGNASSAQQFLETTITSYFTPIVELFTMISSVEVDAKHATQQYHYCLQFFHKNMSSIEYFLGTTYLSSFTAFSLVEKLTRLIELVFHNIASCGDVVQLSDFTGSGILDMAYFERKFVPASWELLRIFGFKSIPIDIWRQLEVNRSTQNETWWSTITASTSNQFNVLMHRAPVVLNSKNGVSYFDLEKARIAVDICSHTSSLLELVSRRHTLSADNSLYLDIISVISGFLDSSEIAVLNFQQTHSPIVDVKFENLRAQIYSTAMQICENLVNVIYRYLSTNAIQARNLQNQLRNIAAIGNSYPKAAVYNAGDSKERRMIIDCGVRISQLINLLPKR